MLDLGLEENADVEVGDVVRTYRHLDEVDLDTHGARFVGLITSRSRAPPLPLVLSAFNWPALSIAATRPRGAAAAASATATLQRPTTRRHGNRPTVAAAMT